MTKITTICPICEKEFSAYLKCGRRPTYCSFDCRWEGARRHNKARCTVARDCAQCGKTYFLDKWKAREGRKFCSKACQHKARSKYESRNISCCVCNKPLKRTPAKQQFDRHYCGYECMGKGKRLAAPRTNKFENVRTWLSRFDRISKCERCGFDDAPGILVVHHKDRNRENNQMDNLEVLCPNCHAVEHLAERKSGWKGHKSNHPVKIKLRLATQEKRRRVSTVN